MGWKTKFVTRQRPGQKHKQETDSSNNAAAINRLREAYVDVHEGDQRREQWKAFREFLTIGLLLATVVLTGLTYWVFYCQLKISEHAVIIAHEDAENALKQAHRDSDAALKQAHSDSATALTAAGNASTNQHNDTLSAIGKADAANSIARNTAKQQLRAYATIPQASIDNFGDTSVKTSATIILKNVGSTPAYQMSEYAYLAYVPAPFGPGLPPHNAPKKPYPRMTLATGEPFSGHVTTQAALTQAQIDAIRSGDAELLMWGELDYLDTFNQRHKTDFRFTYGGKNPVTQETGMHPDLVGNSSD